MAKQVCTITASGQLVLRSLPELQTALEAMTDCWPCSRVRRVIKQVAACSRATPSRFSSSIIRQILCELGLDMTLERWAELEAQVRRSFPAPLIDVVSDSNDEATHMEADTYQDTLASTDTMIRDMDSPLVPLAQGNSNARAQGLHAGDDQLVVVQADDVVVVARQEEVRSSQKLEEIRMLSLKPAHQLVAMCVRSGDQLEELRRKRIADKQRIRRQEAKIAKLELQIVELEQEKTNRGHFDLERKRGGVRMTARGSLALAIRRNMSCIAAADIGPTLMDPVTRWSVTKYEVECAATIIASARSRHQEMLEMQCDSEHGEDPLAPATTISWHTLRGDATNSGVLHEAKMHVFEAGTTFFDTDAIDQYSESCEHNDGNFLDCAVFSGRWFADTQRVTDNSGARALTSA